jgi:riboflavin kinase/FMN adenylyltransferase
LKNGRVVILGNFDGVHIGHQAIISEGIKVANELGCTLTAWTFDTVRGKTLCEKDIRKKLLCEYGVEEVVFASFSSVKDMSPEQFVDKILCSELNAKAAVCGYNYSFGAGGKGTPELLKKLCGEHGIIVRTVKKVSSVVGEVSSSRIRMLISEGKVSDAAALLGRPFALSGQVSHGAGLGRTVGIPTVNFDGMDGICLPKFGVYATLTRIGDKKFVSLTNVGVRPTVNDARGVTAETHILDFSGDLYGKTVMVEFLDYIREETAFPSLEALSEQIKLDAVSAKGIAEEFFKRNNAQKG